MTQSVILSKAKYLKPRFFPFALFRVRMTSLVKICVNLWLNYVFFFVSFVVYNFLPVNSPLHSLRLCGRFSFSFTGLLSHTAPDGGRNRILQLFSPLSLFPACLYTGFLHQIACQRLLGGHSEAPFSFLEMRL